MSTYPIRWYKTSNGYGEDGQPIRQRESYILIYENGAVEGWRTPEVSPFGWHPSGYYGGVEVHAKAPLYYGQPVSHEYCEWTKGPCYHDGSSLAFDCIEWFFGMPDLMFAELERHVRSSLRGSV